MAETRVIAAPASAGFAWPKLGVTGVRILTILVAVAIWEGMARSGLLYKDVVPPIERIIVAIYNELIAAAFYYHLWITFAEVAVGFVVGSLIGLALGIVLGTNPFFRKALEQAGTVLKGQFNQENPESRAVLARIDELAAQPVKVEVPDLSASLSALQAYVQRRQVAVEAVPEPSTGAAEEASP